MPSSPRISMPRCTERYVRDSYSIPVVHRDDEISTSRDSNLHFSLLTYGPLFAYMAYNMLRNDK